jgi:hypothetical protein
MRYLDITLLFGDVTYKGALLRLKVQIKTKSRVWVHSGKQMSHNTQGERQDDTDSKPVTVANLHFLQLSAIGLFRNAINPN